MTGSGEHRLALDTAPTEPCPPSFEEDRETLPSMMAPRVPDQSLTTAVLDAGDEHL